ncbi:MAG: hypothetical protein ACRET3_15685, partial [Burkholderiales bacterium]
MIDNVIRHDLTPPPAAPPIVRELLAGPLSAADSGSLFDRSVPGSLRKWGQARFFEDDKEDNGKIEP